MSIIEVKKDNFEQEVLKSEKIVLADFYANWCGPCRVLKTIINEVAEENEDVKIVSINIDEEDELSEQYNVSSIPCLVLFENGKEIKRNVGMMSKTELLKMIGGK